MKHLEPDVNEFLTFLNILTQFDTAHSEPTVCWQGFSDADDKPTDVNFFPVSYLESVWKQLTKVNKKRYTVSVAINEIDRDDNYGRRLKKNVSRVRAQVVDIDSWLTKEEIRELRDLLNPTIIVCSSTNELRNKFKSHFYFLYAPMSEEENEYLCSRYTVLQNAFALRVQDVVWRIAEHLSGEKVVDFSIGIEKALRAPGFLHQKNPDNPFLVTLAHTSKAFLEFSELENCLSVRGITSAYIEQAKGLKKKRHHQLVSSGFDRSKFSMVEDKDGLREYYTGVKEGERHNAMLARVSDLFRAHKLSFDAVLAVAAMENQKNRPPLEDDEVLRIVEDCFHYYEQSLTAGARKRLAAGDGVTCLQLFRKRAELVAKKLATKDFDSSEEDAELKARFNYTYEDSVKFAEVLSDTSIVYRTLQRFPDRLLGSKKLGLLVYDENNGTYTDDTGIVRSMLLDVVADMPSEPVVRNEFMSIVTNPKDKCKEEVFNQKEMNNYLMQIRGASRLNVITSSFINFRDVQINEEDLDCHPSLINCPNGVIDLESGRLLPHAAKYRMTHSLIAPYVVGSYQKYTAMDSVKDWKADERGNRWTQFIYEVMGGDIEMMQFLQVVFGYTMFGKLDAEVLFFFEGGGQNGKSACLETVMHAFGSYGAAIRKTMFLDTPNSGDATTLSELYQLRGRRMALSSEILAKDKINDSAIKDITTGAHVTGKLFNKDPISYKPQFTTFLHGNQRPHIVGKDFGIWRRIVMVPFKVCFTGQALDTRLKAKLKSVAVMNDFLPWCVAGAYRYAQEGLVIPSSSIAAKEDYQAELNPIERFVRECLILGDGDFETIDDKANGDDMLYAYQLWCGMRDEFAEHVTVLGKELRRIGITCITARSPVNGKVQRHYNCSLKDELARQIRDPGFRNFVAKDKVVDFRARRKNSRE